MTVEHQNPLFEAHVSAARSGTTWNASSPQAHRNVCAAVWSGSLQLERHVNKSELDGVCVGEEGGYKKRTTRGVDRITRDGRY